ncbi:MAG: glycosyltransferase family 2 protein [Pseudomonadota bacterium]
MRLIVSTMKDEGPFILEWVAHYQSLGFDHFLIATNDCSDGTDAIIKRLEALGIATHLDNPGPWPKGPQAAAYDLAMAHPKYSDAEWIMVCDADEFLDVRVGDHTIDALFTARPKANAFAFCWLLFGHSGIVEFQDHLITAQMTRCTHPQMIYPHQARGLKTLFRNNGVYRIASTHRPKRPYPNRAKELRWVDGDGGPMPGFNYQGWAFWQTGQGYGDALARMNHYAVRSIESYLMKRARGDVNTTSYHDKLEETGQAYWQLHCWNLQENTNLAERADKLEAFRDRLLSDKELSDLHLAAVSFHMERIRNINETTQAIAFKALNECYTHGSFRLLTDNVYSDPNAGYTTEDFDPRSFLKAMQRTRAKELAAKRVVRQYPWYMNMDALETPTSAEFLAAITGPTSTPQKTQDALPVLPKEMVKNVTQAIEDKKTFTSGGSAQSVFLSSIVRRNSRRWLLIGGRDRRLIADILAIPVVETLHVIEPWGYRNSEASLSSITLDPRRKLLDQQCFETVMAFGSEIKKGRLRIIRSTPMDALKLIEDHFFDVSILHGARTGPAAEKLLHELSEKTKNNGRLVVDAYRMRNAKGRGMMEALHRHVGAKAGSFRIMAVEGRHVAIEISRAKTEQHSRY